MTTARRAAAALLLIVTVGFLWVAALTPLRSAEIAELDAEALRLGQEWADNPNNISAEDDEAEQLRIESNERFAQARALEPPLDPIAALGGGLLALSGAIALWPSRSSDADPEPEAAEGQPPASADTTR